MQNQQEAPQPANKEKAAGSARMENYFPTTEQYHGLKRGDIVEGVIVRVDRDEILVDIGYKTEGVIRLTELGLEPTSTPLAVGDSVLVYVLQPENKEGNIVLSLARARAQHDWRRAKKQFDDGDLLEAEVIGYNKGGLIVRYGEIRGFVPASQVAELRTRNRQPQGEGETEPKEQLETRLSKMMGRKLRLKIIEVDQAKNRLILSELAALRQWRDGQKERLLTELLEGDIRQGKVSSLCDFGAFIDLGGADGLVHLSELSWYPVSHPSDVLHVGDQVEVYVLSVDKDKKRIALSLKRLQPEPWTAFTQEHQVGDLVRGTVTKLANFGAFVEVENGIEGLVHVSELTEGRVVHPKSVVKLGEKVMVRIIKIDNARHRLGLSLKQAREIDTGMATADQAGVSAERATEPEQPSPEEVVEAISIEARGPEKTGEE